MPGVKGGRGRERQDRRDLRRSDLDVAKSRPEAQVQPKLGRPYASSAPAARRDSGLTSFLVLYMVEHHDEF
jgi:hypothetical protein